MPLTTEHLAQFSGTENYHRFSRLFRNMVLSDGAHFLAEEGKAYWLMEAISSYQSQLSKHNWAKECQFWELNVSADKSAILTCRRDSNYRPHVSQKIEYTSFPLTRVKLWVMPVDEKTMVIMLPSEY